MSLYVKEDFLKNKEMRLDVYTVDNHFWSVGIDCGFNDESINTMAAGKIADIIENKTIPENKTITIVDDKTKEQITINGNKIKKAELIYDGMILATAINKEIK